MGQYCCCGVKRTGDWVCECDWDGWYLCFEMEHLPKPVPIKVHPDSDGTYLVRTFDEDYDEDESEFSLIEKNWGESTNKMISRWKIEYCDGWTGYMGVYAWKGQLPSPTCYQDLQTLER